MIPLKTQQSTQVAKHRGPPPGIVAIVYLVLFAAGIAAAQLMNSAGAKFPLPYEPVEAAHAYYTQNAEGARVSAFFHFGSAIPLGIFTAVMTSRLRFLGLNVAGVSIALFGGFAASILFAVSALSTWVISQPSVAEQAGALRVVQLLAFATGGVGYVMPMGLLLAGISIPCAFARLLPRWMIVFGLVVAVIAELSWFSLLFPQLSILLPLARFPGFLWMIAAGFALPKSRSDEGETA